MPAKGDHKDAYGPRHVPQERRDVGPNEIQVRVTKVSMSMKDMLNVVGPHASGAAPAPPALGGMQADGMAESADGGTALGMD
mmetsp:Transcript_113281/g.196447  ORF Transcript_113281/g.196447 Transcript_113281/m.196447 type:complete len:82 (-) Transcript_113281:87-332(-)